MIIYFMNTFDKFQPDLIRNDRALGFFEKQEERDKKRYEISSWSKNNHEFRHKTRHSGL